MYVIYKRWTQEKKRRSWSVFHERPILVFELISPGACHFTDDVRALPYCREFVFTLLDLMWRNRPFYTGSRAIGHQSNRSATLFSSDSIKPVVRQESRRTLINQRTR